MPQVNAWDDFSWAAVVAEKSPSTDLKRAGGLGALLRTVQPAATRFANSRRPSYSQAIVCPSGLESYDGWADLSGDKLDYRLQKLNGFSPAVKEGKICVQELKDSIKLESGASASTLAPADGKSSPGSRFAGQPPIEMSTSGVQAGNAIVEWPLLGQWALPSRLDDANDKHTVLHQGRNPYSSESHAVWPEGSRSLKFSLTDWE